LTCPILNNRLQPSAVLAYLSRTPTSILDHGENIAVHWAPDGGRIIIQVIRPMEVNVTALTIATDLPVVSRPHNRHISRRHAHLCPSPIT
jgi:hypothetical protein